MKRRSVCAAALALACSVLAVSLPAAPSFTPTPFAQANYMLNCMGCHLADGSGAMGKVPSLRESLPMLARSSTGRRYLVQVPGSSQSALSNRELAEVLNWMVRNLSARPMADDFAPFTASEVGDYRRFTLVDVQDTRARLLGSAERSSR